MSDHEFYAQPTVFDHWHASIGNWLCARLSVLCPYSWVIGFGILGSVFLITAMAVLTVTLSRGIDSTVLFWNDSIAQGLTVVVGLTAAQTLFRQALDAWPAEAGLPAAWQRLGHYVGWQPSGRQQVSNKTAAVSQVPPTGPCLNA